jgi:hypothetical protein
MTNNRTLFLTTAAGILMMTSAASAEFKCAFTGEEQIVMRQSNGFRAVLYNIVQKGKSIKGTAISGQTQGNFAGAISKSGRFKVTVTWGEGGAKGVYTADVDSDGAVEDGVTYDAVNPDSRASWTAGQLPCGD